MSPKFALLISVAALSLPAAAHAAASPPVTTDQDADAAAAKASNAKAIVVTGHKLDEARASIQPSLGATAYGVDQATIQKLPGGDNQPLNQLILQVPGVVQDGFGQLHVRDDHNGLQYRINGTILPEGLAVFGQTLSPRLINSFNLLTGALPAQYGLRTAGIVDITTKTGFQNKGEISLYGGSHDTIEPSFDYGGSTGSTNYFVSGSYTHNRLGIESVDGSSNPLHDKTDQENAFAYVDHIVSDSDRVSFLGGFSNDYFQIPNPRDLHAADGNPGWNIDGQKDYLSNDLNERQLERTGFGAVSWLHHDGAFTWQTSLYARYSELVYRPDVTGELLFNGQAQDAKKQDFTVGIQSEAAYKISDHHTLRGGVIVSRDRGVSDTDTFVFPGDFNADGTVFTQTGQPESLLAHDTATEWTESVYLQDEWKIVPTVTLNFGGRFDHYCGYRCEHQFSPRVNAVWQPSRDTTFHIGYARYFSPPPFENVATTDITSLQHTSAAPTDPKALDTTPYAERQNYFDAGVEQKFGAFTVSIDGYYRKSKNLIDEGQFGAPIILTPFNYRHGKIHGVEGSISYQRGPWMIYGNFAYAKAQGKDIVSSQFSFDPGDLTYIANHYIYLDHDQTYTGSAGISYSFEDGFLRGSKLGGDMLYGSGLRTDLELPNGDDIPNGAHLKGYAQFNLTASHKFDGPGLEVRLDVTNVLDHKYEIRDGNGVGVGAPEYGPRRGVFVGITKDI
ncbi:TonB-dependent receptor [Sphingomonas sp. CGMCC 1.13654]|uniref:TonB-dependent receptor n=1 Tax=Sphingomonas chungangi TaxID=2683589 RepID=A0A838L6I2_9SPHN|nr:TonB-dependent receptor [Sphingomonas chungangi]MBA2934951.1 TonB-dependent receptor [Sphingomonas chungangi]MVW58262.1 TonB-dependent receptor [Sphingomonas chungangi]